MTIHRFAPPALVPKLDRIAISRIKLPQDARQARGCVAIAGRELKEKAAEFFAQDLFDCAKFLYQHPGPNQSFFVGDQAIYFDGITKAFRRIPPPTFHRAQLGPAIERRVELHGVEGGCVMLEPAVGALGIRIKNPAPMPVEPARTTDVNFHALP